jgi:DNA mismatch repair protein MutL
VAGGFWASVQVLAQANLTYILAQSRKSLILVDQHAAHERIVFERLMKGFKNASLEVQNYLLPLALTFDGEEIEALLKGREDLERLGLTLDSMGPDTVAVRSAPAILKEAAVEKALYKFAREKIETGGSFALENTVGGLFATMACHSVVRAGQSLSREEMTSLLSQMDEFPFSAFCPHGRPVFIEKPFGEIEREFGRIL